MIGLIREVAALHQQSLPGLPSMQSQLSDWERGRVTPSAFYQRLLCELYELPPERLGFSLPRATVTDPAGDTEDVQRREFLRLAAAGVATAGWQRRDVDASAVGSLEESAVSYRRLYHAAKPADLLPPVRAHLAATNEQLRAGPRGEVRGRLLIVRSELATLAGRLSFFDLHDPISARGYYDVALEAAREAGDDRLALNALGHTSFVPASEGGFVAAADYLRGARFCGRRAGDALMTSWLAAVESELHTNAGDYSRALVVLDHAEAAFDHVEPGRVPPWFDYYDRGRLAGFRGYALLRSGRHAEALSVLGEAVAALPSGAVKQRTVFLTDLASVHAERGDLEEGCRLAGEAAEDLGRADYATGAQRLYEFRTRLEPWRAQACVRELDERLVSLAA